MMAIEMIVAFQNILCGSSHFPRRKLQISALVYLAIFLTTIGVMSAAGVEPILVVTGDGLKSEHYTLEQLQKLHSIKVSVRDHDDSMAEYAGVPLEELLLHAGAPMGKQLHGRALDTAVVVNAADHYQAVFSLAELDSSIVAQPVFLAWSRNGEPLPASQGPLRLIAPADKPQSRWVREVTAIELVTINRPAITNAAPMSQSSKP
jgi:DMSO/TMAO reductase YedYZ molybdopterin-dependent catalytic subunit